MVLEKFKPNCRDKVYIRLAEKGRMLPEGLEYVNSWVEQDGNRCFQLMRTADVSTFYPWMAAWEDLVDFEIIELECGHGSE